MRSYSSVRRGSRPRTVRRRQYGSKTGGSTRRTARRLSTGQVYSGPVTWVSPWDVQSQEEGLNLNQIWDAWRQATTASGVIGSMFDNFNEWRKWWLAEHTLPGSTIGGGGFGDPGPEPSGPGFPDPPSEIPPFTTGPQQQIKYHPANRYFAQNYVFEGKRDRSRGGGRR